MTDARNDPARRLFEAVTNLCEWLGQYVQEIGEALRPLADWCEEHREEIETAIADREAHPERYLPDPECHCFCSASHGDVMGICDPSRGVAVETIRSPSLGDVEVPVCGPCRSATIARRPLLYA